MESRYYPGVEADVIKLTVELRNLFDEDFDVQTMQVSSTAVLQARNAAKAIARYARRHGCQVIVVSNPTSSRWQRLLFGNVVAEIRRRTGIPVEAVDVARV